MFVALRSVLGPVEGKNMSHVVTAELDLVDGPLEDDQSNKENVETEGQKEEIRSRRDLFRSASEVNLHQPQHPLVNEQNGQGGMKRVFSDHTLRSPTAETATGRARTSSIGAVKEKLRRHSVKLRKEPKITVSQHKISATPSNGEIAQLPKALVKNSRKVSSSVSETQSTLSLPTTPTRKRSTWIIGASRSPSPSNRKLFEKATQVPEKVVVKRSPSNEEEELPTIQEPPKSPMTHAHPPLKRQDTSGTPKSRRPLSAVFGRPKSFIGAERVAAVPALPKSYSTDRLPLRSMGQDKLPELPKNISKDRLHAMGGETPRRKDELWSNFRALDGDFQKYGFCFTVDSCAYIM
jgi:hypothetical protein